MPDVETARCQANSTARPKGRYGPTPAEMWENHRAVDAKERELFAEVVGQELEKIEREEKAAKGVAHSTGIADNNPSVVKSNPSSPTEPKQPRIEQETNANPQGKSRKQERVEG